MISLGLIDQIQVAAGGLAPGQEYTLSVVDAAANPSRHEPVAKMKATPTGNLIADTLGPVQGGPAAAMFTLGPRMPGPGRLSSRSKKRD